MRVEYGLPPVAALHRAKLPVSLGVGTLVLGGNANPFMLMQTCLNLAVASTGDEQAMTARDVLHWATQGAVDIMEGGDKTGSIAVGKRADLICWRASSPPELGFMAASITRPTVALEKCRHPAHLSGQEHISGA